MAQATCDIGLIGLAVMGQNLVLNMNDHGYKVAVFNRTVSKVDEFINHEAKGTEVVGAHSAEELCGLLKSPRRVMLMVKAGEVVDQTIAIGRQTEEPVPLSQPLELDVRMVGAAEALGGLEQVGRRLEALVRAIPALVRAEVDVPVRVRAPDDLLGRPVVIRVGRPDEARELDVQTFIHLLEPRCVAIGEFGWRQPLALRGLDHLQTVLVGAGQEEHILAVEPLEARQRVGRDRLVGVADMRGTVRVCYRGGDVIGVSCHCLR